MLKRARLIWGVGAFIALVGVGLLIWSNRPGDASPSCAAYYAATKSPPAAAAWCQAGQYFGWTPTLAENAMAGRLNIFYVCAGDPKTPAIVFIHGYPTSSYDFSGVMRQLSGQFYVCALDTPGYGFSDKPKPGYHYSLVDDARLVDTFVRQVAGLKAFTLVTHDKGDSVGLALLQIYQAYPVKPYTITQHILTNGNLAWTNYHIDISLVRGNGFRIRFRASGANSADILGWEVDNISVYAICLPATNLTGEAQGNEVQLYWSPPDCNGGGSLLQEGFEEPGFPPDGWERTIHNPSATWSHTGVGSPVGVRTGNYSAGLFWDYNRQDEWIMARNVFVNGNLKFWSMAYQGSSHGDHYYVKVSTDHGNTWETVMDLSALPPFPGPGGYNQWQEPYIIDMSAWLGDVVDIAWNADDNNGQGLWYYWGIDDCSMGDKKLALFPDPFLYDVYRQNPSGGDFIKVNNQPLSDTAYTDPMLPAGYYKYFIRIVNSACSETLPSDTVSVDVITSVGRTSEKNMRVFPNPATDWIRVKSDVPVTRLLLFNLLGMTVAESFVPSLVESNMQLDNVAAGQYILKIYTANRTKEFLISVVK